MPQNTSALNNLVTILSKPTLTFSSANEAQQIYDKMISEDENKIGVLCDVYNGCKAEIRKPSVNKNALGSVLAQ